MRWQLITCGGDHLVYQNGSFEVDPNGDVMRKIDDNKIYQHSYLEFSVFLSKKRQEAVVFNGYEDAESWDKLIDYVAKKAQEQAKQKYSRVKKPKINRASFIQCFRGFNPIASDYFDVIDKVNNLIEKGYVQKFDLSEFRRQFQENAKIIGP